MRLCADGWVRPARHVVSPNRDRRPPGCAPTLLVLHSISLPAGEFGGGAIEALFTNRLDASAHPAFRDLEGLRVSAHFLVRRSGELVQFVSVRDRAWHAGLSRWRGRERCNDFSIGVELEGTDREPFAPGQYARLIALVAALRARLPLREVAAHAEVAPGRKTDPGAGFAWQRWLRALARAGCACNFQERRVNCRHKC